MKVTQEDILNSVEKSEEVEVSKSKKAIRRKENKALPEKTEQRKRDAKASEKKNGDAGVDEFDENGKVILAEKDFDNPLIIAFKVQGLTEGEEFKVEWKQVENTIREKYAGLKIVYSRADATSGNIAFSQLRIKQDLIKELTKPDSTITI